MKKDIALLVEAPYGDGCVLGCVRALHPFRSDKDVPKHVRVLQLELYEPLHNAAGEDVTMVRLPFIRASSPQLESPACVLRKDNYDAAVATWSEGDASFAIGRRQANIRMLFAHPDIAGMGQWLEGSHRE